MRLKTKIISTRSTRIGQYRCRVIELTAIEGTFSDGSTRIWQVDRQMPDLDLPGLGRCPQSELVAWSSVSPEDAKAKAKAIFLKRVETPTAGRAK